MRSTLLTLMLCASLLAAAQKDSTTKDSLKLRPAPKEQELVLRGPVSLFEALYAALENSNEGHARVEALKKWFLPQLQKQLADTTGKK